MTEIRVADQAERHAALDVTRSFIVQAPAGSGKTALLVERYLRLLKTVQKPEEIVAITFTRKAAAEMRRRVIEQISPELAPRLRIQTIDALCASLTAQMPVLSKFGAQPQVVEDASALYQEAAARTLAEITPAVASMLAHLDNDVARATGMLAEILGRRDQWLRKTGEAPTRAELEATLAAERKRLIDRAQALCPQASPELAEKVLTQKGEWRKRPKPAPEELQAIPGLREALAALLLLPPEKYTDTQWGALHAILALLKPAVAQLLMLFGERGEVDFTQIAHGALLALGTPDEPTDLLLSMDVRVHHLLVDEFQDTSNSQWELLERLTAGWETDDGRTVFVVGDPMQSIYRFRDAQVGLFLHARDRGLPNVRLQRIDLSTNFRSQAAIVDWVNQVFPSVLPAFEDEASGAVAYSASVPFHPPDRRRRADAPHLLRPRGGGAARGGARGRGARQDRDPRSQPQPPRLHRPGAQRRGHPLSRGGDRAAGREAGGAGPLCAHARAHAPRRPRRLARDPARAVVRPHARRAFRLLRAHRELTIWELMQGKPRLARIVGDPRARAGEPPARHPARPRGRRLARARRPGLRGGRDRPRGRRDLLRRARAPGGSGRARGLLRSSPRASASSTPSPTSRPAPRRWRS